jgi:hypothetical protein
MDLKVPTSAATATTHFHRCPLLWQTVMVDEVVDVVVMSTFPPG